MLPGTVSPGCGTDEDVPDCPEMFQIGRERCFSVLGTTPL